MWQHSLWFSDISCFSVMEILTFKHDSYENRPETNAWHPTEPKVLSCFPLCLDILRANMSMKAITKEFFCFKMWSHMSTLS